MTTISEAEVEKTWWQFSLITIKSTATVFSFEDVDRDVHMSEGDKCVESV